MDLLTLSLDAMGGDFGPPVTVPAALQALASHPHLYIFLVGPSDVINPLLINTNESLLARLTVVPANKVVTDDLGFFQVMRQSHGSSVYESLRLVKEGKAAACVSAESTGILMGLAKILLNPLSEVIRPALVTAIPNMTGGRTLLLDLGANVVCSGKMLVQFAVMGTLMAEGIFSINQPRVALLNIGEEENKGLKNIQEAAERIKKIPEINYIGYLEGNELLNGKTDVLVCDGFTGNVVLKTLEGAARAFMSVFNNSEGQSQKKWWSKLLSYLLLLRGDKQFRQFHPDQHNGAFLLGLQGIVIKSHGAANQKALVAAIEQAMLAVQRQIPAQITTRLKAVLLKSD